MQKQKNKSPEIRFKQYTDAWEQRKLGELGSVAMNKRIFKEQTSESGDVPFYKIGTFGGEADAYISRELFEEYRSKYPYPEVGDILISASGSIGNTVEYTGKDEYFQDSNIVWLQHDDRLDNTFLKHFYSVVNWEGVEGSTIKRLYNKNILETKISVPSPTEQKKVGCFFNQLDNFITLHQRKLEILKNSKKSLLQKMFPKKGENVPEIRFPGFTGAWEQRKLNTFSEYQSSRYSANQFADIGPTGSYPVFDANNQITCLDKYDQESEYISIIKDGAGVGRVALRPGKSSIIGTMGYILPKESDLYFLFNVIQKIDFNKYISGSTIPHVYYRDYGNTEFFVPTIKEQELIGKLFQQLDKLITLHQRKLETLKEYKKTMLQKMFI